ARRSRSEIFACRTLPRCLGGNALAVLADHDFRIGDELVRGNEEIRRRRDALENAPRKVELRLVARAEKAAEPVTAQIRRRDLRPKRGRASEMSAYAYRDEDFRLDRSGLVLGVLGLMIDFGFRIDDPRIELRQIGKHLRRAMNHPDHLAAPFDVDSLARLELGDIDVDRRSGGFRSLARPHA